MAKAPNRSTDAHIFVRCTTAQKKALQMACDWEASRVPGAKLPIGTFVLLAALKEAKRIALEKKGDGVKENMNRALVADIADLGARPLPPDLRDPAPNPEIEAMRQRQREISEAAAKTNPVTIPPEWVTAPAFSTGKKRKPRR